MVWRLAAVREPLSAHERAEVGDELALVRAQLGRLVEQPPLATAVHRRVEAVEAAEREIARLEELLRLDEEADVRRVDVRDYDPAVAPIPF
jgi:hypothetical protein